MSKHTDKTGAMIDRLRDRLKQYNKYYTYKLKISEPKNKNKEIVDSFEDKLKWMAKAAYKKGVTLTYTLVAPTEQSGYNCSGCRKRKSGDYLWVGTQLSHKDNGENAWFDRLAKVCSKECGEFMILRLM